jgi:hypothetical protein
MSSADAASYYVVHKGTHAVRGTAEWTLQVVGGGGLCITVDSLSYHALKRAGRIVRASSSKEIKS